MEKDWQVVFTCQGIFEAELIHGMLMQHGIENVILNQHDSAYTILGSISIYVRKENYARAKELVDHP